MDDESEFQLFGTPLKPFEEGKAFYKFYINIFYNF